MKPFFSTISLLICLPIWTLANNVVISNSELVDKDIVNDITFVQFDITWDNSWRDSENYDAVWVFVKYRVPVDQGGDNLWHTAFINTGGHTVPTGSEIVSADDNTGVFLQRDANGSGTVNFIEVKLRWDYGLNDETSGDPIDDDDEPEFYVGVIEMVYIPQASFQAGTPETDGGRLVTGPYLGEVTTIPFTVSSEASITIANSAGNLWATSDEVLDGVGSSGTLPAAYPKGFAAFYCMKYELVQGQYVDFLNMLTPTQATARYQNQNGVNRYTISGIHPAFIASAPFRPINFMSWMDAAAYADWCGLRPMTELEFEKVGRGDDSPVTLEWSTGEDVLITSDLDFPSGLSSDGTIAETSSNASANCNCGSSSVAGPIRSGWPVGGDRVSAGATKHGVFEMSGNLREQIVTIANGRAFQGSHGDGQLSSDGFADNADWPGYITDKVSGASGAGVKGGDYSSNVFLITISNRSFVNLTPSTRTAVNGFRAVRTAP